MLSTSVLLGRGEISMLLDELRDRRIEIS